MKIYIRSDIERLGDDRFNRIHAEIHDAIIKDKKDRTEVIEQLDNLLDTDQISDEEYDSLRDWVWQTALDPTYRAIQANYPRVAEIRNKDSDTILFSIYDLASNQPGRYALLNEQDKSLVELAENPSNPKFLSEYTASIIDNHLPDSGEYYSCYVNDLRFNQWHGVL